MAWTTAEDIRAQVQKLWDQGRILSARLTGESLFPLTLRSSRPNARELSDRFAEAQEWIRALEAASKTAIGVGYEIAWTQSQHRQLGANRMPQAIVVSTEDDALALVGKQRPAAQFDRLVQVTREREPALLPWLAGRPVRALQQAAEWERLLAVVAWFRAHPRPQVYLRQVDAPEVHSKFIEQHRGLLSELLDRALPAGALDRAALGASAFEARYGLRSKPSLLRFRILDSRLYIRGLSDLTTPIEQFAQLDLPVRRVFITENIINGLAFPDLADSLVLFGLGYGLEPLARVPWLADRSIYYWGDIDTHGFAMLNDLRAILPEAQSLLMDRQTLADHQALWVEEPSPTLDPLARLTVLEQALYDDLCSNRLGKRVRLEQERIAFHHVVQALARLDTP